MNNNIVSYPSQRTNSDTIMQNSILETPTCNDTIVLNKNIRAYFYATKMWKVNPTTL